jgi:hypothetical protein
LISVSALYVGGDVFQCPLGGEYQVQAARQLLVGQHELEADVLVVEQIKKRIMVVEVGQAVLLQQRHDGLVIGLQFA